MKKTFLILFLSLSVVLHSQSWVNQYLNVSNTSQSSAEILSMPNGDFISVSNETSSGITTINIMRLSPDGNNIIWSREYSEARSMVSHGAIVDIQGNVLFYGAIGNTNTSAFYTKIDGTNGTILFQNTLKNPDDLAGSRSSQFIKAIQLFDNNYVLIGTGSSTYTNITSKIDQNSGTVIWNFRTQWDHFRTSYAICQLANGNLILAGGQANRPGNTLSDNVLISLDQANGTMINFRVWDIDYNFNNQGTNLICRNSNIDNIINIPNTNEVVFLYHVIGHNGSFIEQSRDYGLARYNYVLDSFLWDVRYDRNGGERGSDLQFNPNTNEIILTAFDYLNNNTRLFHRVNASNGNSIQFLNINQLGNNNISAQIKISNIVNSNNILLSSANNFSNNSLLNIGVLDINNWLTCLDEEMILNGTIQKTTRDNSPNVFNNLNNQNFSQNTTNINPTFEMFCVSPPPQCLVSNNYTLLNTSIIDNSIVYDGKYYVNGIITFSGEILVDITNCDFVFNGCGSGLRFINGARLRANNSVFRPCNEDEFWMGIEINGSLNNKIHECTFKNAVEAIQIIGFETDAVITNNLFQNNFRGILFNNTQSTGSIAGNTFDVNNANSEIPMSCLNSTMQDISFNGIRVLNSNLLGDITQNRFVGQFNDNVNSMKGIVLESSNSDITLNSFTNQDIAIRFNNVFNIRSINIFNNTIEYNRSNLSNNSQIQILNINNIFRINNNNINQETILKNGNAIEVQNSSNGTMAENNIRYFNTGIFVNNTHSCVIKENEIKNCRSNGIVASNSNSTFIGCNIINLITSSTDGALGIAVTNFDVSPSLNGSPTRVLSNCIMDSRVGLFVTNPVTNGGPFAFPFLRIPDIRNNFIYNYRDRGMDFLNITGSVGNSSNPGKNTLYSNINGALDVVSVNGVITMNNNYITAPVYMGSVSTVGPLLTHHSNASCANQINKWGKSDAIDLLMKCEENSISNGNILNGDFIISSGGIDGGFEAKTLDRIIAFNPSNYHLIIKNVQYNNLTINEKKWLEYQYKFANKDYLSAKEVLKSINHISDDELIKIRLHLEYLQNLSEFKNSPIALNYQSDSSYNNMSNTILNLSHKYAFEFNNKSDFEYISSSLENLKLFDSRSAIKIYPNPTKDIVNIDYFNSNSENTDITIVDISGKTVWENSYSDANITININVSQFLKGIYIINVKNNTENITSKIVVQ